ncbi:tetratricopeptide repeat protein [uncultured Roseovarius sp.]|uniref:tetratricopeptide repeat protein n=1 Tax=uncultured Roseovarius sp. TaxID=293344 RepID=UPI0026381366|nr:tetratricopeptide repeat protein [uncultured Roseovarius sp.]
MKHTGALLAIFLTLTACSQGSSPDNPYAPGVKKSGEAVDGLIVGNRLMAAGEYDLALDAFTRAALTHGMSSDVLAGLGTANLGLGRLGQAEDLLRQALEKDERSPEIWNNLGVVLIEQGKNSEAEQFFRRAYALDNGESDSIRDNLRLALAKTEDSAYGEVQEQDYKLVRRGSSDFVIRKLP